MLIQMNVFGQNSGVKPIDWGEEKLTWNDFKADPEGKNPNHAASSATGLTYTWSYATTNYVPDLSYEVTAHFYPDRSWVRPDKMSAALLAHEQLHFDISELHAIKLRKALEAYVEMRNIRTDLRKIYTKIEAQRIKMQHQYDRETKHGLDKAAQAHWNKKITVALQAP